MNLWGVIRALQLEGMMAVVNRDEQGAAGKSSCYLYGDMPRLVAMRDHVMIGLVQVHEAIPWAISRS